MPWTCPACGGRIIHSQIEPAPRLNVVYRCPICRLELVLDPVTSKLTVPAMKDEGDHDD